MEKIITKEVTCSTNIEDIERKVNRLQAILEEANSLIKELASTDLEVHIDV